MATYVTLFRYTQKGFENIKDHPKRLDAVRKAIAGAGGELVGFYLTNSPQMLFAWLGSWGIGCAPAMINYNLAGEALIHCVKLSATKILLVDSDSECIARIEAVRSTLEGELGIRIVILDAATEEKINNLEPKRPGDEFRKGMLPTFPMALIYTR